MIGTAGVMTNEVGVWNPSTGEEVRRIRATEPGDVAEQARMARAAQRAWAERSWQERREVLSRWRRVMAARVEELADAVTMEVGKPGVEAMGAEMLATLEMLRWTIRNGGRVLAPSRLSLGMGRRWLMEPARLAWRPLGVVGILGAWNYPIFLNAPLIAHAMAAGNGVVWKPSELTAHCGELLQQTLMEAGVPDGLVRMVQGGPEVGRALAESEVDKVWYTGGIAGGRAVMEILARRGVPAVAELSGFDPAIVLPDAPLEPTARAMTWAAFVGAGQTCVSIKRIYVIGNADSWVRAMGDTAAKLRVGDPSRSEVDLGPLIREGARARFHAQVRAAVDAGAEVVAGGEPAPGPGWFYRPTVLRTFDARAERALEGCFGPVVMVRGVQDAEEAIDAANASIFGLAASVWSKDRREARKVADRLDAGAVGINEAVSLFGHPAAPAGGMKASGYGVVHGALGLRSFAVPTTRVEHSSRSWRPQVFPYSERTRRAIRFLTQRLHPGK